MRGQYARQNRQAASRHYKKHIETSERRLRNLKQKGQLVEGRFYKDAPNWKMIITIALPGFSIAPRMENMFLRRQIWRFHIIQSGEELFYMLRDFAGFGGVAKAPLWTSNCV